MDAVFPALIGVGFWFMYEAWTSGKSGQSPHPVAKVTAALKSQPFRPDPNATVTPAYPSPATVAAPSFGGSVFGGGAIHP